MSTKAFVVAPKDYAHASTGAVTFAGGYEIGLDFRRDSRLLVTNSPEAVGKRGWRFPDDCNRAWMPTTTYFQWDGRSLRELQTVKPCPTD